MLTLLKIFNPEEVSMKEYLVIFSEHVGFKEGIGPKYVGPSMEERRLIDSRVVIDVVDYQERK